MKAEATILAGGLAAAEIIPPPIAHVALVRQPAPASSNTEFAYTTLRIDSGQVLPLHRDFNPDFASGYAVGYSDAAHLGLEGIVGLPKGPVALKYAEWYVEHHADTQ